METNDVVSFDGGQVELRINGRLAPTALRAFLGATPRDAEVDAMVAPGRPLWLQLVVWLLRAYRRVRPASIGCRCVFDPSCSRYAELAYRRHGLLGGTRRTLSRLHRCRPGAGGVDEP